MSPELKAISTEFKTHKGFRTETARKIMPYLVKGLTEKEVIELLGEPDSKSADSLIWYYTIFYSQMIDVCFNKLKIVENVDAIGL